MISIIYIFIETKYMDAEIGLSYVGDTTATPMAG